VSLVATGMCTMPTYCATSCLIQFNSLPKNAAKSSLQLALRHRSCLLTRNSGLCPISAVNCANLHGTVLPVLTTGTDYDVLITDDIALISLDPVCTIRSLGFDSTRLLVTFVEDDTEW